MTATSLALRLDRSRSKKSRFYLSPAKDNRQHAAVNHTIQSCFSLFSWRVPARSNFSRVFAAAPPHWTRRWKSTVIEELSRFRRRPVDAQYQDGKVIGRPGTGKVIPQTPWM